jgi:hypothetical protein
MDRVSLEGLTPEVAPAAREWFPDGVTGHGLRYLHGAAAAPDVGTELLFEQVRRSEFDELPSRFTSIFAFESLRDARSFRARYPGQLPQGATAQIWEVEGDARLRANMALLDQHSTGLVAMVNARAYWAGEPGFGTELWEVLLDPPVTLGARAE